MALNFTFSEAATLFGRLDGLDREGVAVVTRQMRHYNAKGFLPGVGLRDERGTIEINGLGLYRARILAILAATGRDVAFFRELDTAFDGQSWAAAGLKDAIVGTAAGEPWSLRMQYRIVAISGVRSHSVSFVRCDTEIEPSPIDAVSRVLYEGSILLNAAFKGLPEIHFDA